MKNRGHVAWTDAVARHSAAAIAFAETARAVKPEAWSTPVGDGKWSPAQVTEHLNRTYQVTLDELRGKKGLRIRTPWLLRQVLRQTVLRSIYRKRQLPPGARAPSEIMPTTVDGSQSELLERFLTFARDFDEEALSKGNQSNRKLTHHVFGEIDLLPGIDFIAIHIEHHHRQIMRRS
jgi:hypothetical protein